MGKTFDGPDGRFVQQATNHACENVTMWSNLNIKKKYKKKSVEMKNYNKETKLYRKLKIVRKNYKMKNSKSKLKKFKKNKIKKKSRKIKLKKNPIFF